AETIERHVDLERLLTVGARVEPPLRRGGSASEASRGGGGREMRLPPTPTATPPRKGEGLRVAVARDVAFQFYYREILALLEAAGAELVFWSPLSEDLPE